MINLRPEQVVFSPVSVVDDAGKVFFFHGRVFRAIYSEQLAKLYSNLLEQSWLSEIFERGLIKTWVPSDITLFDAYLVLEHEAIPYETHPAESTNQMHWLAAKTTIDINLSLAAYGYTLKDAHPWNVMFQKGRAIFIDFGSIVRAEKVTIGWLEEFKIYFGAPVWLASTKWNAYALEYRRQHNFGFGIKLFKSRAINWSLLRNVNRAGRYLDSPVRFFENLREWLENHKPTKSRKEYWSGYNQRGAGAEAGEKRPIKHTFVYEVLSTKRPAKVLDLAANKGHFSEIAARLGADVLSSDYEEFCVDECLDLAVKKQLNITPAMLNFSWPTPSFGLGLSGRDSYERFRSDIVLAVGIIHHVCIAQHIPVEVFCNICMRYAEKGVVLEYVDSSDIHVASWNKAIPPDYSLHSIANYMKRKFPNLTLSNPINHGGLNRMMVFYHL